jgi:hypothetical protein
MGATIFAASSTAILDQMNLTDAQATAITHATRPQGQERAAFMKLMLATAFAVLVLPTEAEAYTPEGRQACTGDAFRLCSAEIPNVDRVRACLHRNKAQLSPGCRGFISPGAHR